MLRLDPLTVTVMLGLMSLLSAAFLVVIRLFFPNSVKGLNNWVMASILYVLAGLTHALKEDHSTVLLTVFANCSLIAGLLLFLRGLQEFYERPVLSSGKFWGVLAFVAILIAWFKLDDSFHARIIVMTCALTILFALLARFVYRYGLDSFGDWLMITAFVVAALVSLVRLVSELVTPNSVDSLFDVTVLHITYLSSFSLAWLLSTLGFIALISDQLQSRLHYLARHDVMTGTLNRAAFFQEAEHIFAQAQRTQRPLAVLILDIDHFKGINDTYGHQEGDRVLVQFCSDIREKLESDVLFGRYGGEEFVILLSGADAKTALDTAQTIRETVRQRLESRNVTVSIGVASVAGSKAMPSVDDLLSRADEALYQAKRSGRDRVILSEHSEILSETPAGTLSTGKQTRGLKPQPQS